MTQTSSAPATSFAQLPKPSPLASRDPNTLPQYPTSWTPYSKPPRPEPRRISQRPPQHSLTRQEYQSDLRARQRLLYLQKVRASSEEQRWLSRSNKIMRQQYLDQHRQWEHSKRTVAAEMDQPFDEDDTERELVNSIGTGHDEDLDRIVYEEDQEIEALATFYEQHRREDNELPQPLVTPENDDEGYESLFWEVLKDKQGPKGPQYTPEVQRPDLDNEMDLSLI